MEEMMMGFVMVVIGKLSKVVVFALEPAFSYIYLDCLIRNLMFNSLKLRMFEYMLQSHVSSWGFPSTL